MGILGQLYREDSTPAFALYKFSQSFTAAVGFFYSSVLTLPWQILIQGISLGVTFLTLTGKVTI